MNRIAYLVLLMHSWALAGLGVAPVTTPRLQLSHVKEEYGDVR